ncbi:MAG TPA: hypothetical protein VN042_05185 [Asticcacaulis sp.]|nr:hypothetical protein [Asticcacaulis sp.]
MKFPKLTVALTGLALLAGLIGWDWREARRNADARLAMGHVMYSRGCSGCFRTPETKSDFQLDLFGDGTVIYQEKADSDGRSFVTHVDSAAAKALIRQMNTDAVSRTSPPTSGADAPYCYVDFYIDDMGRVSGCSVLTTDELGNVHLLQELPLLGKLEDLVNLKRLQSFDHNHPPDGISVYPSSTQHSVLFFWRLSPPPPPPNNSH